jgi:nucleoside-diphosphate-sugar epimerase
MKILVTGSEGLIGRTLCPLLAARGHEVVHMDIVLPAGRACDVVDVLAVADHLLGCDGVIHLAACSRVIWGEKDPFKCALVNVHGTLNVVAAARKDAGRPWILFASSREVYGDAGSVGGPNTGITEDVERQPFNTYAYTKALGEDIVLGARVQGLRTAVVRLSSVYGDTKDHVDRVAPAFARAAALGDQLVVRGSSKAFDFVHITDTARGLALAAEKLAADGTLPTVHLATGHGTTLGRLASIAVSTAVTLGRPNPAVITENVLPYEVTAFVGNPARARELLDWEAQITIEEGFARLIRDFLAERPAAE